MDINYLRETYSGKRVFLTGHTGFKGAWLLQILHWLGAEVKGYALPPENGQDLYHQINGQDLCCTSCMANLNDLHTLCHEMIAFKPHFVFHLAAQAFVRRSYVQPAETFSTNAQGTVHMLEALRQMPAPAIALMITTDKVYENPERGIPFREDDRLGGYDPYSASKAAAEIIISSYRSSFFAPAHWAQHGKSIASVRAGNVIGGGDFSQDRIIPDIVRALEKGQQVTLRNPDSVRPWQHVLEPLSAYLLLAAKMNEDGTRYASAFNIGPEPDDDKTVAQLTDVFLEIFNQPTGSYTVQQHEQAPHEAKLLLLDSSKAKTMLGWKSKLNALQAIRMTAEWYADKHTPAAEKCMRQISAYFEHV
jgi:CDP-glucose 4,6-dehydratase